MPNTCLLLVFYLSSTCLQLVFNCDTDSIIRVAYKENVGASFIKQNLIKCVADAVQVFKKNKKDFAKLDK